MTSTARPYRSALRTRQAEETRARIVAAAARLFAAQGYQATTISAIAKEAGVSAETVKTTAAKAELLIAAFEVTFSGSEAAETLADTEAGSGLTTLPDDVFLDAVITQIDAANERVSRAESIRKFTILDSEWTEASGHLTPKLSIKRNIIMNDFADEISAIYDEPVATTNVAIGG